MVKHLRSLDDCHIHDAWLTIGSFDGVHIGHQEIIRQLTAGAHDHGDPAVVVTFYPHPLVVIQQRKDNFYLTTPTERAQLLGELGVDIVLTHKFNRQVASLTAREFIVKLKSHFDMRKLWIGHDFALGHNREGDVERLKELGNELNYVVNVHKPIKHNGQIVSSSLIRNSIREGELGSANQLLGRLYQVGGVVISGDGRGKSIGIPTANLELSDEKLCPRNGVYACLVDYDGEIWPAATNIGYRPTFDGSGTFPHVETHIIGFEGDLYGKKINIQFMARIRSEQKFLNVEKLINQIEEDIQTTKGIFKKYRQAEFSH